MANVFAIRGEDISATLHALNRELGDNGKAYRRAIRDIKKAGDQAVNRARGYLPQEDALLSGFTRKNSTRFPRAASETQKRAFPTYDRFAAISSIRSITARERARRTDSGWQGGRTYGVAVEMRDPAGSIYDVAGNGRSKRSKMRQSESASSRFFIAALKSTWLGDPHWRFRVLLPAVVDTRPEIIAELNKIIEQARRALHAQKDPWETIK